MKKTVVLLIAPLIFSGCMSLGSKIDEQQLNKVETCKTTESEILKLFGNPWNKGFQSGYKTLNWQYASISGTQNIIVFVNKNNLIVDFLVNPVGLVQVNDACDQ